MSRILIDLPAQQVERLSTLAETEQRPRAALIRDAIAHYLTGHASQAALDAPDVFGAWKHRQTDGLQYQNGLREEW